MNAPSRRWLPLLLAFVGGLALGLLAAPMLAMALMHPAGEFATHAYRQGLQDAIEDCRTTGAARVDGVEISCRGGSTIK